MARWSSRPIEVTSLLFFDLETTGLRPDRGARIVEIAVLGSESVRHTWSTDRTPPNDSVVVGQCRHLSNVFADGVVVGHNLQFDLQFLAYEADRLGVDGPDLRFIDTLSLVRQRLDPPDARLDALANRFDLVPNDALHTALGDARATRALFRFLVDREDLHTLADAGAKELRWSTF